MAGSWVLRFPRSDDPGFLLVQACAYSDAPLDLDLLATEGEAPFKGKIHQRKIVELRSRNFPVGGSDGETDWQRTLQQVFNPRSLDLPSLITSAEHGRTLEAVASVDKGKVAITLRHRIDKITQRLGSIELVQDDDAEIQLYDWCGNTVERAATLEAEKAELYRTTESAQTTITSLETRLEELVKAKVEYEEQLISKFVLLLNEKKLKIRSQQRLLIAAKVDASKVHEMEKMMEKDGANEGPGVRSSKKGKRRAEERAKEDDDSSDGFDNMDIDAQSGSDENPSSNRASTPDSGTETETETEVGAQETVEVRADAESTSEPGTAQSKPTVTISPPPKRELPFKKKAAQKEKAASAKEKVVLPSTNDKEQRGSLRLTARSQGKTAMKDVAETEAALEPADGDRGNDEDETASEGDDEL